MKIAVLPLDERPCSYDYPLLMSNNCEIILPEYTKLGYKKTPMKFDNINLFMEDQINNFVDAFVISIDMLFYGGLIPSRVHNGKTNFEEGISVLKKIKKNTSAKIFVYSSIMRCPGYYDNDEEPKYYVDYGYDIFMKHFLEHKEKVKGGLSFDEAEIYKNLKDIPSHIEKDYINRRKQNLEYTKKVIKLAKKEIIDFMIVPQDDSAEYGLTRYDKNIIEKTITKSNNIISHPGADEVSLTLISRAINELKGTKPKLAYKFSNVENSKNIPLYEGEVMEDTVVSHIKSSGYEISSYEDSEYVLFINSFATNAFEACDQCGDSKEQINEFIIDIKGALKEEKKIIIADCGYCNGSDIVLLKAIIDSGIWKHINSYASWNTSSNTLGSALCFGIMKNQKSIMQQIIEAGFYQAIVRKEVELKFLGNGVGHKIYETFENKELSRKYIVSRINELLEYYKLDNVNFDVTIPWNRLFEIGVNINE